MTEEEEMEHDYKRGNLSALDRKVYEETCLNKTPVFETVKDAEISEEISESEDDSDEEEEVQKGSILQKYHHPVESFMLEHLDYFFEDFNCKVQDMMQKINDEDPGKIDEQVTNAIGSYIK